MAKRFIEQEKIAGTCVLWIHYGTQNEDDWTNYAQSIIEGEDVYHGSRHQGVPGKAIVVLCLYGIPMHKKQAVLDYFQNYDNPTVRLSILGWERKSFDKSFVSFTGTLITPHEEIVANFGDPQNTLVQYARALSPLFEPKRAKIFQRAICYLKHGTGKKYLDALQPNANGPPSTSATFSCKVVRVTMNGGTLQGHINIPLKQVSWQ
jgi:hypothetical protein